MRKLFIFLGLFASSILTTAAQPSFQAIAASYPEGAYWHEGKLYYAEMGADRVSVLEDGARRDFFVQRGCGPTAIAAYGRGFVVLCHLGKRLIEVGLDGVELRRWGTDETGKSLLDPNDVAADGRGGVYFTDPGLFSRSVAAQGYVRYLSAEGRIVTIEGPLWYPNGVYVDVARRRVYVTEHMTGRVYQFEQRSDAGLEGRAIAYDVAHFDLPVRYHTVYRETGPDGLEVGPDGVIYQAVYGAGVILKISREGALLGAIATPARFVTNISFDDAGGAYVVGSFDNANRPFPGEVRYFSPAALQESLTDAGEASSSAP